MSIQKLVSRYISYNHWANERQVNWLKTLDPDLLYKETPSSFGSIDGTLQHIIHAQTFWLAVINQGVVPRFNAPVRHNEIDSVMADLLSGSNKMIETFGKYSEEELHYEIQQEDLTERRYEFIIHVVNHGSFHRGQVVTLARHLGVTGEIPVNDYDAFMWVQRYGE